MTATPGPGRAFFVMRPGRDLEDDHLEFKFESMHKTVLNTGKIENESTVAELKIV